MTGRLEPETNPELTGRFEVREQGEVTRELRRMVGRRAPVMLYDNQGQVLRTKASLLSSAGLVLDLEENDDHPVLYARRITLVSLVDDVKVQGDVIGPLTTDPAGWSLTIPLPNVLIRLQRRGGYRARIPPAEPAFLYSSATRFSVLDLSVQGVGLEPSGVQVFAGDRWGACRLRLGMQVLPVSVVVRHVDPDRIGCAFEGVGVRVEQELARRVMELDRLWMRSR